MSEWVVGNASAGGDGSYQWRTNWYTCPGCGTWLQSGASHVCTPIQPNQSADILAALLRIEKLLDKVVDRI